MTTLTRPGPSGRPGEKPDRRATDRVGPSDHLAAPTTTCSVIAAVGFGAVTFAVAALGSVANRSAVDTWYAGLVRPWFAPPNAVFGPVWTVLYVTIAVAGWLLWRSRGPLRREALALWGLQLALNLAWSFVFFAAQSILGGMVVISALWASIVALMLVAGRTRPVVSWLLLPYVAWVSFATALNAGYLWLN